MRLPRLLLSTALAVTAAFSTCAATPEGEPSGTLHAIVSDPVAPLSSLSVLTLAMARSRTKATSGTV